MEKDWTVAPDRLDPGTMAWRYSRISASPLKAEQLLGKLWNWPV